MRNKAIKTPLFNTFRKAFHMALTAHKTNVSAAEIVQRTEETTLTRRKFIENTSKTLLIGSLTSVYTEELVPIFLRESFLSSLSAKTAPRIAIVGAGLAGLTALHTLQKAGLTATIYEASGRVSGRIFTVQNAMGEDTWTEFGGEFIDTNHTDMWQLTKELNLELMDLAQISESTLTKETFFFGGKYRDLAELVENFKGFAPRIAADAQRLPDDLSYKTKDPSIKKLDHLSISEYLEKIGARGWVKDFIEVAYESEYGLSPQVQSSINLISLISPDTEGGKFDLFGDSDERYKIKGGNQSIADALAKKYADHIALNRSLDAITQRGKHYELHFSGMKTTVKADFVVLALPFSKLKNVDIRLKMPQVKWDCINTLGFGTNSKLMIGMDKHFWRAQNYQGLCYSDIGIPNGWDNAQLQTADDKAAGLSILFGGASGIALGKGSVAAQKDIYLPKWEKIYKGATEHHNGKVARMHWPSYPYALGSYTCYVQGQYTGISGAEALPIDHVFFAGEHCGGEFAGFMNGAALSGRTAAEAIIAKIY